MEQILIIAGTRPEIIKLAPVYLELRDRLGEQRVRWVSTGQHSDMADVAMQAFGLQADEHLDVMANDGSLTTLTLNLLAQLDTLFERCEPALVVAQGDTTTAFTAALTAFYRRIPVAHVEAGLRSFDLEHPYPEESNRRMIGALSRLHFPPTRRAADCLKLEGIEPRSIVTTGNTVVDAIKLIRPRLATVSQHPDLLPLRPGQRRVLVTMHRRESWGSELESMCAALRQLADEYDDLSVVFPVHLNPRVRGPVHDILGDHGRITLVPPLDYLQLQRVLSESHLVLTDSGGIQEEAPSYGVPVLVLRKVTERTEALECGQAKIVGTRREDVLSVARELLDDPVKHAAMAACTNPFGDGRAAKRIATVIENYLDEDLPLLNEAVAFGG